MSVLIFVIITQSFKSLNRRSSSLLRLSRSIYDRVSSTLASALRLPTSFSLPDQKARRGVFRQIWISSFALVCQTNSHKFPSAGRNHGGDLDLSALYICDLHSINTHFFHLRSLINDTTCLRGKCNVYFAHY